MLSSLRKSIYICPVKLQGKLDGDQINIWKPLTDYYKDFKRHSICWGVENARLHW